MSSQTEREDLAVKKEVKTSREDVASWIEEYGNYLYRYALQRVKSPELAEDLVHDALLSAYKARESFEGRASPKTWLVSILRNKIIDHCRRAKRVQFFSYDALTEEKPKEEQFGRLGIWKRIVETWSGTPEELTQSKEFMHSLQSCVEKLPDSMQQVFLFKTVDQLSTKEICEATGVTENNVWVILHRARLKMRECLNSNWFSADDAR